MVNSNCAADVFLISLYSVDRFSLSYKISNFPAAFKHFSKLGRNESRSRRSVQISIFMISLFHVSYVMFHKYDKSRKYILKFAHVYGIL